MAAKGKNDTDTRIYYIESCNQETIDTFYYINGGAKKNELLIQKAYKLHTRKRCYRGK